MEVMGICNVTPDSFSDGGVHADHASAIAHARDMVTKGATIIDIGGESTRPGATPVEPAEEWQRIAPVVSALVADGAKVSVDTYHAGTAARAIEAGAHIINDVTGGRIDPDIFTVVADSPADYVLQHSRGGAATTNDTAVYEDIAADIVRELSERLEIAVEAGIDRERIILDPGLGFSKVGDQDWQVLARLEDITGALPGRWLVGHSRKRFLPQPKDAATAAVSALLAGRVWGVRVHDVAGTVAGLHAARMMTHA